MLSRKNIKYIAVCTGLAILVVCALLAYFAIPNILYYREYTLAQSSIDALESKRPSTINEEIWEVATRGANNAFGNICFSESHVTYNELRKFRIDLEEHTSGNVDLSTIDWIWRRLSETGPHGNSYRNKFRHIYLSDIYTTTSYEALANLPTFEAQVDDLIIWNNSNIICLWIYVTKKNNERINIEITANLDKCEDIAKHLKVGYNYKFPDYIHEYL